MILGIDFDNTIVCYDQTFYRHALAKSLIPTSIPQIKNSIRDYCRKHNREDEWTELQGVVYGTCMHETEPFPGVISFFDTCSRIRIPVFIISHKTRHPYKGTKYDLHNQAYDWIKSQGLSGKNHIGVSDTVFFELTKEEKIQRIKLQKCTHFIDDLPEFFAEPAFPQEVYRILFDPHNIHQDADADLRVCSWSKLSDWLSLQRPT